MFKSQDASGAAGARRGHRQGDRRRASRRRCEEARAAIVARHADAQRGRQARGHRRHRATAATRMRAACWPRCPRDQPRRRAEAAADAIAAIDDRLAALERGAEPLVRPLARLGAAARRHRPRHHLRRHGRHQHGAWRDGDARRLHHLRRAGGHPHTARPGCSTTRWRSPSRSPSWSPALVGIAIERGVIRFLYGRPLETLLATWGVSLILQQAVRTIFGADQPRGRRRRASCPARSSSAASPSPGTGSGSSSSRWPGLRRAAGVAALHVARPADARRDAEPAHGELDGHPHRPGSTR